MFIFNRKLQFKPWCGSFWFHLQIVIGKMLLSQMGQFRIYYLTFRPHEIVWFEKNLMSKFFKWLERQVFSNQAAAYGHDLSYNIIKTIAWLISNLWRLMNRRYRPEMCCLIQQTGSEEYATVGTFGTNAFEKLSRPIALQKNFISIFREFLKF